MSLFPLNNLSPPFYQAPLFQTSRDAPPFINQSPHLKGGEGAETMIKPGQRHMTDRSWFLEQGRTWVGGSKKSFENITMLVNLRGRKIKGVEMQCCAGIIERNYLGTCQLCRFGHHSRLFQLLSTWVTHYFLSDLDMKNEKDYNLSNLLNHI